MTELKGYLGQGPARLLSSLGPQAVRICTQSKPIRGRRISLQEIVTKLELICLTSILRSTGGGLLHREDDKWGTKIPDPGCRLPIGCSLLLEAKWRLALGLNVEAFFRNLQQRNQPLSATKYSKTIIFQYFYQDQNRSRLIITLECKIKTISSQYFQSSQIIKPIYIKSVQEPLFYTNSNINLANKEHFGYFKWHRKLNANTPSES